MNQHLTFRHWIALSMKGIYRRAGSSIRLIMLCFITLAESQRPSICLEWLSERVGIVAARSRTTGAIATNSIRRASNLTDFWEDTSPNRHKRHKVRPGVNELKQMIPERAILLSTNIGDLVVDPFGGGRSTFQAGGKIRGTGWVLSYMTPTTSRVECTIFSFVCATTDSFRLSTSVQAGWSHFLQNKTFASRQVSEIGRKIFVFLTQIYETQRLRVDWATITPVANGLHAAELAVLPALDSLGETGRRLGQQFQVCGPEHRGFRLLAWFQTLLQPRVIQSNIRHPVNTELPSHFYQRRVFSRASASGWSATYGSPR
jgi:hypothetical protein